MYRRNTLRSAVILMLLAAATTIGCAKDPTARYGQARETLTVAQNGIVRAHQQQLISDKDFVALDPYAQAARGALARAEAMLPEGGEAFDWYMKLVEDTLTQLSEPAPLTGAPK